MAVAVVVLLASFAIAQTFEIGRIMLARDRATRERDRADRVTQFMTNMFKLPNPSEARGNKAIAREILDQASKDIDNGLANDPELRAKTTDTMAATYLNLGLITRAQPLLERAAQLQRRVLGSAPGDTLASMSLLASTYVDVEPARAEKLLRETLATQRRVLGPEHPDVLGSMDRLVTVLLSKNDYAGAEKLLREMLDRQRRALGRDDVNTLTSMDRLAFTLSNYDARYAEAEKLYRETLDIQRRVLGQEHPETLWSLGGLAATLLHEARYHEAEKLYGETIDVQRRVLGPEHPQTLKSLEEEAIAISRQGRYSEAEVLFRQTIQIAGKSNEPGVLGRAWYNFGCTAAVAGHRDDALKYLTEAVDHGYKHAEWMEADNDLKSLHGDPLFEAIVAKGRDSATAKP